MASFGRVIKVAEPLPPLPEKPIWSNHVSIRKVKNNGAVECTIDFASQAKVNDPVDKVVRKHLNNALAELPRQP